MYMERLRDALLLLLLVTAFNISMTAQSVIDLSGDWQFRMDPDDKGIKEEWWNQTYEDKINLPSSMPEQLKGYDISVDTKWVGSLYDSSYFFNPYMAKYRKPGKDMKLQFRQRFTGTNDHQIIGPSPAVVSNFRGIYRFVVLIKTAKLTEVQTFLREAGMHLRTDVAIDIDPITMM